MSRQLDFQVMAVASASSSSSSSSSDSEQSIPTNNRRNEKVSTSSESDAESSSNLEEDSDVDSAKIENESESDEEQQEVKILSHKEQRRLKKKLAREESKKGIPESAEPKQGNRLKQTGRSKALQADDNDANPKRQNSIWVGNMSYKTTPDALRGFFKEAGEVTRVHMPMQAGQKNRGYVI